MAASASWVEAVLIGNVGIAVATIAVAMTGFALLSGRISWRRGANVILGCFILFGASAIASGLRGIADLTSEPVAIPPAPPPAPPPTPKPSPQNYDPYAGASVAM